MAEPSSSRAQCKPPASPQVGAGTAGKPSIATSCASTSCEASFSCTLPEGGVIRTALTNPVLRGLQLVPRHVQEGTSHCRAPRWESLRRSTRDLLGVPRKRNLCSTVYRVYGPLPTNMAGESKGIEPVHSTAVIKRRSRSLLVRVFSVLACPGAAVVRIRGFTNSLMAWKYAKWLI